MHTLGLNCAENIQDRPGQPAYEMLGIKRRFQLCKAWPPRFKESSVRAHQIWVPLEKVQFLLLSTNLAREWLQIDTDLLLIITSTADELSGGTNIDDLERPWMPKISIFCDYRLWLTLRVNFRWNILEIDQDNLRTKLNWCCRASHEHQLRFLVWFYFH